MSPVFGAEAGDRSRLTDPARLRVLRATGLLDGPDSAVLDRLTRLAGRLSHAPVALVSVVDESRQVFPSMVGLPEPWASRGETPLSHSFCQQVVAADAPLIVEDARADERVRGNPAILEIGVVAYAGYPLHAPQGHVLGSFCVIDTRPRRWSAQELVVVADLAAAVEAEITVRLSHAELTESEARFRSLFESSPIGMALVGLDGTWLRVNPAMAAITGYDAGELQAMDFQTITHPDDLDSDLAQVERLVAGEISDYRMHKRYLRKDGTAVWCLLSVTLVRDEDGTPQHFLSQIVEVDAERRNRQLLDVSFDSSPDLHLLTTATGRVLRANAAWQRMLGWTEADLRGMDVATLIHPDDLEATRAVLAEVAAGTPRAGTALVVNRYRASSGEYRWLQWHGALLPDQGLVVATGRDVTDARAVGEALRRSEEQSRAAFDASPLGMVIADTAGCFVRVNPAFANMLRLPAGELIGRDYRDFTHPDDLEASRREVARVTEDHRVVGDLQKRFLCADGTTVWAHVTVTAITGPDGLPQRLIQIEDITVRRDAEARADRETARLRTTIAIQREVAAAAADRDVALRLVADRLLRALPAADGGVVGLVDGAELYAAAASGTLSAHTDVRVSITGSLAGLVVATGETLRCDDALTDKRVNRISTMTSKVGSMIVAPLFDQGRVFGTLGVASTRTAAFDDTDTEQLTLLADALTGALRHAEDTAHRAELLSRANQAVAALEISEARFRSAFDNSPLGMVMTGLRKDNLGVVLQANQAMAVITGYPADRLAGMPVHDFHHPEDQAETDRALAVLSGGDSDTFTTARRYRHADGHPVWVQLHAAVVRDDQGRPLYLVTQVQDVTAQRAAEEQLHQRAQLLDLTQDAVIVRDLDGRILYWNPAAQRIYGWAPEIAAGHDLDRLLGTVWPGDATQALVDETLHRQGAWSGEVEHRRADGRRVTVLSRKALQRDADGTPVAVLSINTDVTARRRAEQALADSEQRFRSQFAHSAIGQVIRGADDRIQEVNPAFAAMLGYPAEQLLGTPAGDYIAPEAHAERARALASVFTGQADSYRQECQLLRADGTRLEVDLTVSAIRDETGHPHRFVGQFQDISDRKAAEAARDAAIADLADRNTELEGANQLKQDLIGMLGHEIGNPLCAILGYTETITASWDDLPEDEQKRMLKAIDRNAHQLDGIVREVLAMVTLDAGRLTATPEPVPVAEHLATARANAGSTTDVDCGPDLVAFVQPGHLDQILTNLLSNAAKYGGGATRMAARAEDATVRITVRDDGPGVPAELRASLFERFSRAQDTARTVKGTGLGLYIVRELARANGGDVHYEPAPERGSVFVVILPATTRI